MINFLKLIRIHQWLKNFLIFIPFILSNKEFTLTIFQNLLLGFFCFSLAASSIYIFNDLFDLKSDRKHKIKKYRPLSSGQIKPYTGFFIASFLLFVSFFLLINFINQPSFLLFLIIYCFLNFFYSLIFKKIIIFDIIILTIFYILRLIVGGVIVNIDLSFWLICYSLFIFLSLAILKRFVEISSQKRIIHGRDGYFVSDKLFLQIIGISSSVISVLILALYFNTEMTFNLYKRPQLLILNIFLYFIWVNYIWLKAFRRQMDEDIIKFTLGDKCSVLIILSFIIFFILSKY
jgi:4-hydroxybenzoate polyprenyltransferase